MLTESSVNYSKLTFRLWIINLKKQSLPQALRYLSVLYLLDGSFSRKSLMNVAHDQCFSLFVYDCVEVTDPWELVPICLFKKTFE